MIIITKRKLSYEKGMSYFRTVSKESTNKNIPIIIFVSPIITISSSTPATAATIAASSLSLSQQFKY